MPRKEGTPVSERRGKVRRELGKEDKLPQVPETVQHPVGEEVFVMTTVLLQPDKVQQLRVYAANKEKNTNELIRELLDVGLQKRNQHPKTPTEK